MAITILERFGDAGFKGSILNSGTLETATPSREGPTATPIDDILRPNI